MNKQMIEYLDVATDARKEKLWEKLSLTANDVNLLSNGRPPQCMCVPGRLFKVTVYTLTNRRN
ncbi:hypothetical protein OUZ56_004315 [Daphnia magna]|uniref:Uncharacterized protein n=1 Tax=Daphnia magna TaxID=35525 RepID=A0ABQ9YPE6_9CRUS|nr:hypothetical protein OUZ56_004315 [Daphnia magna]